MLDNVGAEMPDQPSTGPDLVTELAVLLGGKAKDTKQVPPASVTAASLKKLTLRQLADAAQRMGLSPPPKIKKEALVPLVWEAWQALLVISPAADALAPVDHAALSHKFEVGEPGRGQSDESREIARGTSKEIPWGYGRDRITAMPIDPDRLFAYWEVRDESIAKARTQLGQGGAGAWLNLRVYDTTGRIFDGTNAHGSFDHRVERGDRQWFFPIGKPTSELIVEIGLKSEEGYFVKVARSARVEFPRREPAPATEPEWLTVRMATGQVERSGGRQLGRPVRSTSAPALGSAVGAPRPEDSAAWEDTVRVATGATERHEWREVQHAEIAEAHRRFRWEEPATITSWESGPFPYPVEVPEPVREAFAGKTRMFRLGGRTHVVYGPWHVVIRGLGAEQSRVILSRWEVYRSWAEVTGHEVNEFAADGFGGGVTGGASERMMGASDRRWVGGSELRLGGSSEVFFLKASETRLGGASERMLAGSSELVRRGASERRFVGASEQRLGRPLEPTAAFGVAPRPPARTGASIYPPPPVGAVSENAAPSSRKGS